MSVRFLIVPILLVFLINSCNSAEENELYSACYSSCIKQYKCEWGDSFISSREITCSEYCNNIENKSTGQKEIFDCVNESECENIYSCGLNVENDSICKQACEKMVECDSVENGGDGALDEVWLESCQNSCDEADEIDDTKAKCIVDTDCENLYTECSSGAENQL